MVARFFVAALLLSGSLIVIPENAGAGRIVSQSLVESGQENSIDSAIASGRADYGYDRERGADSFAFVVSGITLTDITLPDGDGLAFGASVLYAEGGDGFNLRAFGPLESLMDGITSPAFLNRLALTSVDDSAHNFPNNTGGEIRGQRVVIAEPDSLTLLCFGLAVLALSRLFRRSSARVFVFRPRGHRTVLRSSESVSVRALGW